VWLATTTREGNMTTKEEQDFLSGSPTANAVVAEDTQIVAGIMENHKSALQEFVAQGRRHEFATVQVERYLAHEEKALATWAHATGHRNTSDLTFCVVVFLVATTKRPAPALVEQRLGKKGAEILLSRPHVQALIAEIEAGRAALQQYETAITDKITALLYPGCPQPKSPGLREWLAGGRTDDKLLVSKEDRDEAACWF
jgi:hypothetical protein